MTDLGRPSLQAFTRELTRALQETEPPAPPSREAIACRASLAEFFRRSWTLLESDTSLVWNWHMDAVCEHLQALLEGRLGKRNLLINVPPGSAKSRIVSVVAPAWMWTKRPSWRAVFAAGNPRVSTRDSQHTRTLIESTWYRRTFGITWSLADDANTKLLFRNTVGGFRMAVSAGSRITGDRADSLFIDDPIDAADAYSESARDAVLEWFDQAFANRLNDLRTGTRVVIMQRLHGEDLSGHLLEREPGQWEHLCIPQEWDESQRRTTSLGWTDPRKAEGELMFPVRFPVSALAEERMRLGSAGYAGQHQQRPSAAEGEIFKRGHFGFYKPGDPLPKFERRCQSWDTAFKEKEEADYSVGFELGKSERRIYVLDRARGRMAYPALKERVKAWAALAKPTAVVIEDKASGQSVIQDLKLTTSLPIVAMPTDGDKVTRAHTIVPTYEAGVILLPEGAAWVNEFLDELHAFPKAAHDDQVDAFVQGVRWLINPSGTARGLLDYYRQHVDAMSARKATEAKQPTSRTVVSDGNVELHFGPTDPVSIAPMSDREGRPVR